jgi:hypothetical protein
MDEYKEIDPRVREAQALIKLVMIAWDKWYPDNGVPDDVLREKYYFRSKLCDSANRIAKILMKES